MVARRFRSMIRSGWLAAAIAGLLAAHPAPAAVSVHFLPGTYVFADSDLGPAVDTLTLTVSGGTASFVLTGQDNYTFTVPDGSTPSFLFSNDSIYYYIAGSGITASWDTTVYQAIAFFSAADLGGLAVGTDPGGPQLFNGGAGLFESSSGAAVVFAPVPEPASWAVLLAGLGSLGAAIRAARRRPSDCLA